MAVMFGLLCSVPTAWTNRLADAGNSKAAATEDL